MPEEPPTPPPSRNPQRHVGTGLAGETTRGQDSTLRFEPNQPLEVIGDFEVLSKLGQGGMGSVYRARQVSLDRQVALKLLPANFEADADYVARFQREARVAANLKHPNLVRVYTLGVAAGSHFIAMELVEGETLAHLIKRGPLPPLEALRIVLDVARALECGWRTAQLIHRDIKPGNVFLSTQGDVKLGDLGLAKIVGGDTTGLTQTGTAMGTPHYISPEQARGDKELDFRADIYSLGCTLYQMLTQQTPYSGSDPVTIFHHHIHSPPPAILKVLPQCPLPLARLVAKMLKKQRRERFGSYEELIAQIESVRAQLDPTLAAPAPPPPAVAEETPEAGKARRAFPDQGTRDQGTRGAASLPAKSKLPLYGGIAAALLVLGLAGWLFWPREAKLTKAQIWARQHPGQPGSGDILVVAAGTPATGMSPLLAYATKDAPFVNTLGMKFVPVPITGGPTSGQPVLFSVWDTRVQDYEVFAKETKHEWPKPDFEQGPTHPAVDVSWEDAQLFCQWLTQREQAAGRLPANFSYRLPSDHEWSCAVDLGAREDAAMLPNEKSLKIYDAFPWGAEWPPPTGAGNYAGEELRPALAAGKYPSTKDVLAGYNDGFVNTSPVGSFAANRFGLYDMGGNVSQWCEDWFDKEQLHRVIRGGSWAACDRGPLRLSARPHYPPAARGRDFGFRCVLAPVASAAGRAGETFARPVEGNGQPAPVPITEKQIPDNADHEWDQGTLRFKNGSAPRLTETTVRDVSVRASMLAPLGANPSLDIRFDAGDGRKSGYGCYILSLNPGHGDVELISHPAGHDGIPLQKWPLPHPYRPDEWIRLELRAVGNQLSVSVDGQHLGTVHDDSVSAPGKIRLNCPPGVAVREVEYVVLDGPGPASARDATITLPATATKDAPFVNTLGMKFVPVPIVGGPTHGQPVLFSVWDTRVQDYEAFVKETKHEWPKPEFEQGPTHPAVNVSWEDAQQFCQWLTQREQAAGRLPANWSYRLPSDHEWSCAVGLGAREDAARLPTEKDGKISDAFPWGTEWPPPKRAGNYLGEEVRRAQATGKNTHSEDVLAGYDDGFVNTSPVESFSANAYGLYDMGGNVWQWCEDRFDKAQKDRVLRGASYSSYDRRNLLSSLRIAGAPGARYYSRGFRCVAAPSAR